jgi:drug/metabolite transporter (DMT)-like permease
MSVVWGASFLFIKVALEGVNFYQVAWARLVFGALTLAIIMAVLRLTLPREPIIWLHFSVVAITNCVIPYLAFAWAEQFISSGLASIVNAFTPIATALFVTLVFAVEKLGRGQVLGVVIGIIGVIVIIGPWQYANFTGNLAGQLAGIVATIGYGFSFGYIRKFLSHRPIPGVTFAFMNIGVAGFLMLLLTPVIAIAPVQLDLGIVLSLLALGILGTGLVYIWNINVLRAWGPTNTSTVTYVTPVVGVALGILVLGERFGWHEPLGAALVLLGILFTQKRLRIARWEKAPTQ